LGIIKPMRFREIEKIIKDDGWKLVRTVGSHHQYHHASKSGTVTIPNHTGDIGKRVIQKILKQAEL